MTIIDEIITQNSPSVGRMMRVVVRKEAMPVTHQFQEPLLPPRHRRQRRPMKRLPDELEKEGLKMRPIVDNLEYNCRTDKSRLSAR